MLTFDPMYLLAVAAFAFGLSLASYRWFAAHNGWPMGEWQAHRPGLPIAIGLFAMIFAMLFAMARGGATLLWVPAAGIIAALLWTWVARVGAQSALLLAPASVLGLLTYWVFAVSSLDPGALDERFKSPAPLRIDRSEPASGTPSPTGYAQPGDMMPSATSRASAPAILAPIGAPIGAAHAQRERDLLERERAQPAYLDRERAPRIPVERDRLPPAQGGRERVSPSLTDRDRAAPQR